MTIDPFALAVVMLSVFVVGASAMLAVCTRAMEIHDWRPHAVNALGGAVVAAVMLWYG
jgi:menaquinone-dependent protoporphyrinogen IX oxidase